MKDGKAVLLRDDYCDGLDDCLPVCPESLPCGCPGTNARVLKREEISPAAEVPVAVSHLNQWPVQLKLVSVKAPRFENANLFVSTDCAAYAYGIFHNRFMQGKITVIGCPKLDDTDYSEKLTAILKSNNIKSVTVICMEVPCCAGIENAVKNAIRDPGKMIP